MSSGWLDLAQAAKRAGRSERTVRRWIEAGHIKLVLGRMREGELLEVERRMRGRRGRPRKDTAAH